MLDKALNALLKHIDKLKKKICGGVLLYQNCKPAVLLKDSSFSTNRKHLSKQKIRARIKENIFVKTSENPEQK